MNIDLIIFLAFVSCDDASPSSAQRRRHKRHFPRRTPVGGSDFDVRAPGKRSDNLPCCLRPQSELR